mgnify:CR=1 FL=1
MKKIYNLNILIVLLIIFINLLFIYFQNRDLLNLVLKEEAEKNIVCSFETFNNVIEAEKKRVLNKSRYIVYYLYNDNDNSYKNMSQILMAEENYFISVFSKKNELLFTSDTINNKEVNYFLKKMDNLNAGSVNLKLIDNKVYLYVLLFPKNSDNKIFFVYNYNDSFFEKVSKIINCDINIYNNKDNFVFGSKKGDNGEVVCSTSDYYEEYKKNKKDSFLYAGKYIKFFPINDMNITLELVSFHKSSGIYSGKQFLFIVSKISLLLLLIIFGFLIIKLKKTNNAEFIIDKSCCNNNIIEDINSNLVLCCRKILLDYRGKQKEREFLITQIFKIFMFSFPNEDYNKSKNCELISAVLKSKLFLNNENIDFVLNKNRSKIITQINENSFIFTFIYCIYISVLENDYPNLNITINDYGSKVYINITVKYQNHTNLFLNKEVINNFIKFLTDNKLEIRYNENGCTIEINN